MLVVTSILAAEATSLQHLLNEFRKFQVYEWISGVLCTF